MKANNRGPASIEFSKTAADHYADIPVLDVAKNFLFRMWQLTAT